MEREGEIQAIAALKKGAHLLKYGRQGKPKFCLFRLSSDESALIWHYGKVEKQLELQHVLKMIPGQRTSVFHRYPRPEKEHLSFSLICEDRSMDLICKDREEADIWFTGLKALIRHGSPKKPRNEARKARASPSSPSDRGVTSSCFFYSQDQGAATQQMENNCQKRWGKAFADLMSITSTVSDPQLPFSSPDPPGVDPPAALDNSNAKTFGAESCRPYFPTSVSSPSESTSDEDLDLVGDILIWGDGIGDRVTGGTPVRVDKSPNMKANAPPRVIESTSIIDARYIACGERHVVAASKNREVFSWGEAAGGMLGHGGEVDVSHPKLVEALRGKSIKMVACGNYHSCAVTLSGDLYTWGDDTLNCGLLGHGSDVSHWIPQKVGSPIAGLHVSFVSCGPCHTALVTSSGQLFTFGDGAFAALGHGDRNNCSIPRNVEALKGLHTVWVACGVWHTAAIVDVARGVDLQEPKQAVSGTLFSWGDDEKGQLGHGDYKSRLVPESIGSLIDMDFSQVVCGDDLTVALTTSGQAYTMGSAVHGQLGRSAKDGNTPIPVRDNIGDCCIEEIACGSHHVAVLTSKSDVFTWGKGANRQLGHSDCDDRDTPTLVSGLKDKQVKGIVCGSNFTVLVCLRKGTSLDDDSVCAGCHNPFNFIRPRHNCYNCGFPFCNACSTRKALKAALAPGMDKRYRVCDDCFVKLGGSMDPPSVLRSPCSKNADPEKEKHVLQGFISKFSSIESFMPDKSFAFNLMDNHLFPLQNGHIRRSTISAKSTTNPPRVGSNLLPPYTVDHKSIRARSPQSCTTSSPLPDPSMEITSLKALVEKLTVKSQRLEAELERKSREEEAANARAESEAENCKAAREEIESLKAQLREISEKATTEQVPNSYTDFNLNASNGYSNQPSNSGNATSTASPECEPSDKASTPSQRKGRAHKTERIVQFEPGVFMSIFSLPNGVNELRRVRFSRKLFTEAEAEKWWAENEAKVSEHYNVRIAP